MTKKEIMDVFGLEEILCQTVEECNELSQACLKMRRVLHGTTDCSEADVRLNIMEEMGDVRNCIEVLTTNSLFPIEYVDSIAGTKLDRWRKNAEKHKKENDDLELEKRKMEMCLGCPMIVRCKVDLQFEPPFFARCKCK